MSISPPKSDVRAPVVLCCLVVLIALLTQSVASVADEVLVRHGDVSVTVRDVEAERLARSGPFDLQRPTADPGATASLINDLYRRKVLVNYARQNTLDQLDWIRAKVQRAEEEALAGAVLELRRADLLRQMPDMEARAMEIYQADPGAFAVPEQLRVAHILLRSRPDRCGDALEQAVEQLKIRVDKGESFEALAQTLSEDEQTAATGGVVPVFGRGVMAPAFEEAAFALTTAGEVSEPVTTPYGVHLIRLLDRQQGREKSFEEVKAPLVSKLQLEWVQSALDHWRKELVDPRLATVNRAALDEFLESDPMPPSSIDPPVETSNAHPAGAK